MTFLSLIPAAIAAAVAIPALLILYFLKLRRRDVEISTTLLWKKAIEDMQANAPFQRLRRNILLILQMLALCAALFALAQPRINAENLSGEKHVLLIDRSGSMTAIDGGDGRGQPVTRLEEAKRRAIAMVDSMREGNIITKDSADQAMVIAFDSTAQVLQTFTPDKAALRRAIEAITPVEGPTRIQEAINLARAHKPARIVEGVGLLAGDPITLHVYSDGRIADAEQAAAGFEDTVDYVRIGKPDSENLGIVTLRAERSFEKAERLNIFVGIENSGTSDREVDVELLVDGVVAGIRPAMVPGAGNAGPRLGGREAGRAAAAEQEAAEVAGAAPDAAAPAVKRTPGTGGVVFSMDRPEGATVAARLRGRNSDQPPTGDVLPLDDRAWLIVPPARRLSVAVVSSSGNLFVNAVLSGLPLSRLAEITPGQYERLVREGKSGEFDVYIFDGVAPPWDATDPEHAAGLPPGRFLVLGALPGGPSGIVDKGAAEGQGVASFVDWSREHPSMRGLTLDGVRIGARRKVEIAQGAPARAIATNEEGPAIIEVASARTRAIVTVFNPLESNWPFNASFVVFVANAVRWLGDDGVTGGVLRGVQVGSVLTDRLPVGADSVELRTPDGSVHKLTPAADGTVVFGPLNRVGVYSIRWKGPAGAADLREGDFNFREYAANLLDSAESNVPASEELALASVVAKATVKGTSRFAGARNLWPWLLLGALGVLMFEWFVYNRKVHI